MILLFRTVRFWVQFRKNSKKRGEIGRFMFWKRGLELDPAVIDQRVAVYR